MRNQFIPKTILSIFSIVVLFTFITTSCDSITGNDCGPFPDKFQVTDFSASVKKVSHYDASSSSIQLSEADSDSIRFDEFAIEMTPITEEFYSSVLDRINFQFIQSAYACSPTIPVSSDTVLDIQIYSDKDFSYEYPAGENLAELFEVYALYNRDGGMRVDLIDFLSEEPNAPDQLILLLKSAPSEATKIKFSVRYLQDGEKLNEFEFVTESVTINP